MKEIVIDQVGESTFLYFNILDDWESFEIIVEELKNKFSAVITAKIDMPESRFCKMSIGNAHITLLNDPYGNSLRADNKDGDSVLQEIFNKWENKSEL